MTHKSWLLLIVLTAGLSACSYPLIYKPAPPMTGVPPAKYRAAVAFVANESKPGMEADDHGLVWINLTTVGEEKGRFEEARIAPKKLTGIIVQDLAASGLFTSVDNEGAGPADVLIKTTIKKALCLPREYQNYQFDIDIQAFKGNQAVFSKIYEERWPIHLKAGFYNKAKVFVEEYSQHWTDLMQKVRADLAQALEKEGTVNAK